MWFSRTRSILKINRGRHTANRSVRLQVETLEGRLLLSGDVAVDVGTARSPRQVPATPDPSFVLGVPVNWFNIQWIGGLVAQPGLDPRHGGPNSPQGGQGPFAPNSGGLMNGIDASVNVAALMVQADVVAPAPTIDAAFQQMNANTSTF